MKKINFTGVNETIFHETLENGLNIYLVQNPNVKNYYITFTTKFGSIDTEFKVDNGEYIKVPNGVAHFLEHLTFKMEDGADASDYLASLGCQCNAYTSHEETCYEVYGYTNFKEALTYLLDYVQTPYYTEENKNNGVHYGLGLAICRNIITKCEGEISYQKSFALGGASFTVTLPKHSV